jgi:hypothetical protein
VKLLLLQEKGLTSTESVSAPREDKTGVLKKGGYGITGFILSVISLVLLMIDLCLNILEVQLSSSLLLAIWGFSELLMLIGLLCCIICVRKKGRHRKLALAGIIIWVIPLLILVIGLTTDLYILPALKV